MFETRRIVIADLEPPETGGAPTPWVGDDWRADPLAARGRRILIVDDDPALRECLHLMLKLAGHQVTQAGNGAEALTVFKPGAFDLVITDFEMPVMPGDELALALKQLAPAQLILMLTASPRARRDPTNPVDALLNKPFTLETLYAALGKLCSTRSEPAQPGFVSPADNPSLALVPELEMAAPLPG